ncbi:MAG: hypothetical protein AMXMBFR77_07180 [Phycisphaerales bacterium]|nr:type II secretion system GspH family protein [Phycisphaerales bacterium]GIK17938.1 MAG: hypothetical protein BroJett004_01020 [Planctomycetota bacterium]
MNNRADRDRRGFTLIELLVAIGAIALIAVGIAAVFESVGRTVTGGRRVSLLNQAAAQIEQQLRQDFRAMSRDGFLVIRHGYVDVNANGTLDITTGADDVMLHPADLAPRPRRSDEIVFLARGQFTSVRDALHPERSPKGDHARIYIGHGARYDADGTTAEINAFVTPEVNHGASGGPADRWRLGARDGPNEFAAEWILARHVTLLIQPTGAEQGPPNPDPFNLAPARWLDSDIQIAGQPAASSLFRHLAQFGSTDGPVPRIRNNSAGLSPLFASGLVDVATTDPAEVRTIICDAAILPVNSSPADFDPATGTVLDGSFQASPANGNPLLGDRKFVHAWLRELFPAHSYAGSAGGHRIRVEPSMPAYVDTVSLAAQQGWASDVLAYRLADQRAVTAHGFVPRCTEFIVEFSFGETVNDTNNPRHGELIWHGLERFVDADGNPGNGPFNDGREHRVAAPYPTDPATGNPRPYATIYRKLDGTTGTYALAASTVYDTTLPAGGTYPVQRYAHFGYFDPTWNPGAANEPPTLPWAWPKLIRITLSLADAQDPSVEQSYQFVFEVPERRSF